MITCEQPLSEEWQEGVVNFIVDEGEDFAVVEREAFAVDEDKRKMEDQSIASEQEQGMMEEDCVIEEPGTSNKKEKGKIEEKGASEEDKGKIEEKGASEKERGKNEDKDAIEEPDTSVMEMGKNKRRGERRKASRQAVWEEVSDKRVSVSYCVRL